MASVRDNYRPRIDALPALAEFCQKAENLMRSDDPETFWDAEPLFGELLLSNLVEDFVKRELGIVSKNDHHYVLSSSEFHAPLVETDLYSLVLKLIARIPGHGSSVFTYRAPSDGGLGPSG